jgi:hypothetical protein
VIVISLGHDFSCFPFLLARLGLVQISRDRP